MKVVIKIPSEVMELHARHIEDIIAEADEDLGRISKRIATFYEY